jgi:gliding motility-associated-like protein
MRSYCLYILLLYLSFFSIEVQSQVNCETPISPVLNLVSVVPETGTTVLNWELSPSPGIAAYVLYTYKNDAGIPFDTIWNPIATSYEYSTPASRYFSVSYVVAAHRMPNCTSPLSNHLNTIFAKAEIDTCNRKISVTWNSYLAEPNKVTGYTIMASLNGEGFSSIGSSNEDKVSFIFDNFITDSEYCFYVIANLEGGTNSKSNKTCVSTEMQRPPDWINADYATVNDNKISLAFTIDPFSEISNFSLERKSGRNGNFTEIAKPTSLNGIVSYTDVKVDLNSINYYRLSAINSCKKAITVSNLSSNIVLTLERINDDVRLNWNKYMEWVGSIDSYKVLVNTGNGYTEISEISSSDSTYTVDYHDIMYDISTNEVCFLISANEISNPHGIEGATRSQSSCTNPVEKITVPDVFTPNNDLINDFFRPVLSFTPISYHLIISDRQGTVLFETNSFNEEWNGLSNGDSVPQGVYLWYLKVTTPSGALISKTGTVTVYFNR